MNLVKLQDTKITAQKSLILLYINNERSGKEIKETISFTITSKRIKYLGINISQEAKDLYSENYMILFREIRDETNRWIRDTMFLD